MIRAWLCKKGAHYWTRPMILQLRGERIVSRECARCGLRRVVRQDVWSDPTRARVREHRSDTCGVDGDAWADRVRELARGGGGAA